MSYSARALCAATWIVAVASQSNLGGQGYVDLSVYGGIPDAKAAGILYGIPNDPAYSPEQAPGTATWGKYFQEAGISWLRAGGAQIPFPGYAYDVVNGGTTGYDERFASFKQDYEETIALNPDTQYVLLPHDIWGADATQASNTIFPCDNGDCTQYGEFLDKLIGDLKSKYVNTQISNLFELQGFVDVV